jgi:hypothetical protein
MLIYFSQIQVIVGTEMNFVDLTAQVLWYDDLASSWNNEISELA